MLWPRDCVVEVVASDAEVAEVAPEIGMDERFSTGDEIPENGIYYVFHEAHRLIRSVRLLKGDRFPRCSRCSGEVVFEMMLPLPFSVDYEPVHIFELPAFSEDEDAAAASS